MKMMPPSGSAPASSGALSQNNPVLDGRPVPEEHTWEAMASPFYCASVVHIPVEIEDPRTLSLLSKLNGLNCLHNSHYFWWYIEASKARLYNSEGDSVASTSQAVLLYVFENILKLLHPFMPFVTEELWQSLPYRKEALMVTAWPPTSLPRLDESVKKFENLQALTRAIRNARAEYSVEPGRRIPASIVANSEVLKYIYEEREVLALLSRLDFHNISFTESPPGDANQSVHLVASEGLEAYLPLSAMVDISAEVQRLSKRLAKMQTEYDGLMARLSSPSFVEKAPEDVVRGVQQKAAETEEKLTLTRNQLSFLEFTVPIAK